MSDTVSFLINKLNSIKITCSNSSMICSAINEAINGIEKLEQKLSEANTLITELHHQNDLLKKQMECRYSGECDYKAKTIEQIKSLGETKYWGD